MKIIEHDAIECGKLMRKDLRRAFPGIKFSVRMSRGTAYGSFDVSWEDGPTVKEVDSVVDKYQGKDFNGMDDSESYRGAVLESVANGLESHSYNAGYILTSREPSDGFRAVLRAKILEQGPCAETLSDLPFYVQRLSGKVSLWPSGKVEVWPERIIVTY